MPTVPFKKLSREQILRVYGAAPRLYELARQAADDAAAPGAESVEPDLADKARRAVDDILKNKDSYADG